MTNVKNRKLLVVLLALALLSLSVMALGGTLAVNDTVDKNTYPTITTPPDDTENHIDYSVTVQYSDTATSGYDNNNFLSAAPFEGTLWCPGYTKVVYIKVTNNEAFPVECTLNLNVISNGFDDMMTYAVIAPNSDGSLTQHKTWTSFNNAANTKSSLKETCAYNVFENVNITTKGSTTYALAIHMDEKADNTYKNKQLSMKFDFRVDANFKPGDTTMDTPQ